MHDTSHASVNGVIERRFTVTKKGALEMILNKKLNNTAQRMMLSEAVHTFDHERNNMTTTGSTKTLFEIFY